MDNPIDPQSQEIIDSLVDSGRYATAGDVVRLGLQLVEEREAKLQWLRDKLNDSIERGGWLTDEQVSARLRETANRWRQERGN